MRDSRGNDIVAIGLEYVKLGDEAHQEGPSRKNGRVTQLSTLTSLQGIDPDCIIFWRRSPRP